MAFSQLHYDVHFRTHSPAVENPDRPYDGGEILTYPDATSVEVQITLVNIKDGDGDRGCYAIYLYEADGVTLKHAKAIDVGQNSVNGVPTQWDEVRHTFTGLENNTDYLLRVQFDNTRNIADLPPA